MRDADAQERTGYLGHAVLSWERKYFQHFYSHIQLGQNEIDHPITHPERPRQRFPGSSLRRAAPLPALRPDSGCSRCCAQRYRHPARTGSLNERRWVNAAMGLGVVRRWHCPHCPHALPSGAGLVGAFDRGPARPARPRWPPSFCLPGGPASPRAVGLRRGARSAGRVGRAGRAERNGLPRRYNCQEQQLGLMSPCC